MASWKNIEKAAGRAHRGRHQPEWRAHLGELEKKKEYKQRATDYNEKRDTLHNLQRKAADRNPDEFYHHMINSKVKDGVHRDFRKDSDEDEMSSGQKALADSSDVRYINYKLNVEKKKIERLKAELHGVDVAASSSSSSGSTPRNKHLIFVDSKEEAESFDPAEHLDTHPSLLSRTGNRLRTEQLNKTQLHPPTSSSTLRKKYGELVKRINRQKELTVLSHKLQSRKDIAASKGGKPKVVRKGNAKKATVYKWQYERKK